MGPDRPEAERLNRLFRRKASDHMSIFGVELKPEKIAQITQVGVNDQNLLHLKQYNYDDLY